MDKPSGLNALYDFIKDKDVKDNIFDSMEHAIYLFVLARNFTEKSYLHFDAIVHFTSAIEVLLYYGLNALYGNIRDSEWKYTDICDVHKYNRYTRKVLAKKSRKIIKTSKNTNFGKLIKIAEEQNLIGPKLAIRCNESRILRNFIHATNFNKRPKIYTEKDVDKVLDTLITVTLRVREQILSK